MTGINVTSGYRRMELCHIAVTVVTLFPIPSKILVKVVMKCLTVAVALKLFFGLRQPLADATSIWNPLSSRRSHQKLLPQPVYL